jgi:hypothetical protein
MPDVGVPTVWYPGGMKRSTACAAAIRFTMIGWRHADLAAAHVRRGVACRRRSPRCRRGPASALGMLSAARLLQKCAS